MEFEFTVKMKVEGNTISVSNSMPVDANAQCILNALEETHRIIFSMLKKSKKKDRPNMTLQDLYNKEYKL